MYCWLLLINFFLVKNLKNHCWKVLISFDLGKNVDNITPFMMWWTRNCSEWILYLNRRMETECFSHWRQGPGSLSLSQSHNTTILLHIWHSFPSQSPVHSTTRVDGRLSLRYPISSLLEPGQFVSSSSSSCRSWIRLERPLDVSWVQPGGNIWILKYYYINILSTILSDRICRNSIEKNIIEFLFVTNLRCIQNLS